MGSRGNGFAFAATPTKALSGLPPVRFETRDDMDNDPGKALDSSPTFGHQKIITATINSNVNIDIFTIDMTKAFPLLAIADLYFNIWILF